LITRKKYLYGLESILNKIYFIITNKIEIFV
jgi:hypothetical protein